MIGIGVPPYLDDFEKAKAAGGGGGDPLDVGEGDGIARDFSAVSYTHLMWSFIHFSYENLNTEEKEYIKNKCPYIKEKPVFIGFDGNRESIYLSIADFLINKMERFVELKRKSLNSHMPMLSKYRIMLNIFSPIQDRLCGETLSKEQLGEIMSV